MYYRALKQLFLWLVFLPLGGCASLARYPDNPPLERFDSEHTITRLESQGSGDILLILTFSGGGSRAAALAYGVLEALADTPLAAGGGTQSMLQEVDMISSVSGGSITAAYYGLYGDRMFRDFRNRFLERDVNSELANAMLTPGTLSRLSSNTFGSGDVLDEYFREQLFGTAAVRELVDANGPFVQINATDLFKGGQFGFTPELFALICSDIDRFPVSRAVAASSAVPLVFAPITLTNRAGSCDYNGSSKVCGSGAVTIAVTAWPATSMSTWNNRPILIFILSTADCPTTWGCAPLWIISSSTVACGTP